MPAPPRRSFFVIYRPEDEDDEPPGAGRDPASVSKGQENKRVEDEARTRTKVAKYCQKWAREHGYRITVKRSRPIRRGTFGASSVVSYFRSSPKQWAILQGMQQYEYDKHYSLIASVITRWGSQYSMLMSVERVSRAIQEWAKETSV